MKRTAILFLTIALMAFGAVTLRAASQENSASPPPQRGGPRGQRDGGFRLIPRPAMDQLNLTDEQSKQVAELEKEIKAKLEKILTPEQMKTLAEARRPRPPQGAPGGQRGPGQGGRRGGRGAGAGQGGPQQ